MKKEEAYQLLSQKMREHGLLDKGWYSRFSTTKKILGRCFHREKIIELSIYHVEHSADHLVLNTILHEIAHALVGPGHGHNRVWKQKAREIGCTGERCSNVQIPGKYVAECSVCGSVAYKHRKPNNDYYHKPCGSKGVLKFRINEEAQETGDMES